MKLADWARAQGIDYKTAYRWFRSGILPVPAEQLPTGTILVHSPDRAPAGVALYARVADNDQKGDLERQLGRLAAFSSQQGLSIDRSISEVGSGFDGDRAKLLKLLADPSVSTIVVEHRDRLTRFGAEYIEAALAACGRKLIVVDPTERKADLLADLVDVLVAFCARRYGRKSSKDKVARAVAALEADD
jgi:putative resolvase